MDCAGRHADLHLVWSFGVAMTMQLNLCGMMTTEVDGFKAVRLLPNGSIVVVFSGKRGETLLTVYNGNRAVGRPQSNGDLIWVEQKEVDDR